MEKDSEEEQLWMPDRNYEENLHLISGEWKHDTVCCFVCTRGNFNGSDLDQITSVDGNETIQALE